MEGVVALLVMLGVGLLVVLSVVVSLGGTIALIVWAVKRSKWSAQRLTKIGASLGLSAEGRRRVVGVRHGTHVVVRHVREGSGDNASNWTYVEAEIDPPLRLGLNLRRQGWLGAAWSELVGSKDITIGRPGIDADFVIRAVEQDEVGRFIDDELVPILSSARAATQRLWLTDDTVHASFGGFSTDEAKVTAYLDTVIGLSHAATLARQRMGPTAREREVLETWGAMANLSGWRFDEKTLALAGSSGRHRFQVVPTLDKSGWSTRFRVFYDRPLGVALVLQKEHVFAKVGRFFGMTDIQLGDTRFDETFRVKGSDDGAVRQILDDATLRQSLLHLFGVARSLEVHDDHVDAVAAGLVSGGAALKQSLSLVVGVAEGLRARVEAPSVGAYR